MVHLIHRFINQLIVLQYQGSTHLRSETRGWAGNCANSSSFNLLTKQPDEEMMELKGTFGLSSVAYCVPVVESEMHWQCFIILLCKLGPSMYRWPSVWGREEHQVDCLGKRIIKMMGFVLTMFLWILEEGFCFFLAELSYSSQLFCQECIKTLTK